MTTDTDTDRVAAAAVAAAQRRIAEAEEALAARRRDLEDLLARLHDDGLPYSELGRLAGFSKQHAGDLVNAGRGRRAG